MAPLVTLETISDIALKRIDTSSEGDATLAARQLWQDRACLLLIIRRPVRSLPHTFPILTLL